MSQSGAAGVLMLVGADVAGRLAIVGTGIPRSPLVGCRAERGARVKLSARQARYGIRRRDLIDGRAARLESDSLGRTAIVP